MALPAPAGARNGGDARHARSTFAQQVLGGMKRLVSPMMNSGVRNRSSERATTPSVEFSTGTTPKPAALATGALNLVDAGAGHA